LGIAGLLVCCVVGSALRAADQTALDKSKAAKLDGDSNLWYDIRDLGVEGRGWSDTKSFYDRLPAKAEGVVRDPVWRLAQHSAGMCVRFVTDATTIHARWTLRSPSLAMPHMPATGVSGLDLYAKDGHGQWRWLGVGRPAQQTNQQALASGLPAGKREYLLYLPLYNGVESVQIGVSSEATLWPGPPREHKPIVFYGTSITQGGCASRPGMTYAAILGRWLDRPAINLGFSGNGRMESEVAQLLAELDPCVYVINCLPNMNDTEVAERVEPLVKTIRQARPRTPIVLCEDRSYTNAWLLAGQRERNQSSRAALKAAFARLKSEGVTGLHYLAGENQLGDDREDTVDGSHPTDLGFVRMAEAMLPVLKPLL
jgi:lysophospholipase L1-like esterase